MWSYLESRVERGVRGKYLEIRVEIDKVFIFMILNIRIFFFFNWDILIFMKRKWVLFNIFVLGSF